MAVAFQTIFIKGFEGRSTGEDTTMTHPDSLAAGDLMVAHLTQCSNVTAADATFDTPSGWTLVGTDTADDGSKFVRMTVFAKLASAGDVSAGSTVFERAGASDAWTGGAIYRIDGQGSVASIQAAFDDVVADSTPTYTNTVTPVFADSLLLFLVSAVDNAASGSATDASYSITTSNPTWTERQDTYGDATAFFGASDGDGLQTGATASRPEITATGDSNVTLTNFSVSVGAIVVVPPVSGVTVSPAVITMTASVQAPTVAADASVSVSVITMTASVQAPTVTTAAPDWVNQDKSSAPTWVNPDKS